MSETEIKPLGWKPEPGIGYSVNRRSDGGMHYTFTDLNHKTLEHWRNFSMEHLIDSDRLTTNLYDLTLIKDLSEEAMKYALEVGSDPSARNIRLAVVVSSPVVKEKIEEVAALSPPGGLEYGIFNDIEEAKEWLDRPLTQVI